jgi:broad specificity phosphatase PhoE
MIPLPTTSVFDLAFLTNLDDVTELILVRHGEQEADRVSGTVGSMVDPPLSARGRRQVELVGQRFAGQHLDAIYASPLQRASDTGASIAANTGTDVVLVEQLEEIRLFNDLKPDQTMGDVLGPLLLAGMRDRMIREKRWDVYPFSERSADFRGRVVMAIDGIAVRHAGQRVAIACHGGVINTYIAHHLGIDYDMFFRPAHTAVNVVLAKGPTRSVRSLNDTHHLDGDPNLLSH